MSMVSQEQLLSREAKDMKIVLDFEKHGLVFLKRSSRPYVSLHSIDQVNYYANESIQLPTVLYRLIQIIQYNDN